ncbi:MAG: hypothetical protein Q7U54_21620 [Bacteroidales bacterium]|nr:hypothetical protein [Bacteroidales bacterium]
MIICPAFSPDCTTAKHLPSETLRIDLCNLTCSEMIVTTVNYWNIIHSRTPGEAEQDLEGAQIMSVLGNTMAWLLKMREQTKDTLPAPAAVKKVMTSFIR